MGLLLELVCWEHLMLSLLLIIIVIIYCASPIFLTSILHFMDEETEGQRSGMNCPVVTQLIRSRTKISTEVWWTLSDTSFH